MMLPRFVHPIIMIVAVIGLFASSGGFLSAHAQSRRGQGDPVVEKIKRATLAMQRFSWEQGVVAQAFLESGDEEMVVMLAHGSLLNQTKDGRVAAVGGAPIDPLMCGEAMWHAAEVTHDPDLRKAADNLLEYALTWAQRTPDGTLYHTGHTMWSDSLHCAPPFLAISGHYDEAIAQIEGYRKRLWDPNKRLYAHIWDEDKQTFSDKLRAGRPITGLTPTFVQIRRSEEKGTDVNIATHLVHAAHLSRFDAAVLVSNDSDLAEAVRIVCHEIGKPVHITQVATYPRME